MNHMPVILTDVIPDQGHGPKGRLILSSSEDGLYERAEGDLGGKGEHRTDEIAWGRHGEGQCG